MVPLSHYLALGAIMFVIGAAGVLMRRNAIIILMSIELMLNAVNITFVGFSRQWGDMAGQVFAIFVITIAAAEVALGLGIVIAMYRNRETVDVTQANLMRG